MRRIVRHLTSRPSALLLLAQLVQLLLYPFLDHDTAGYAALTVISMVVISSALWAVRNTPALWVVAICLGLPAMALSVAEVVWTDSTTIVLFSAMFHAPFYFYVSYALIHYLFDDMSVTTDELYAAGAAFTVVAWGFAYLFVAVQVLWPNSYAGNNDSPQSFFELLYLSFTTLTSVGLGDVIPVGGHARSIAMIEQVAGVMYVGVVVARLVGLTIYRSQRN